MFLFPSLKLWQHNIKRKFAKLTKNTKVCIKHFEERDIHTHNVYTNENGTTYEVSDKYINIYIYILKVNYLSVEGV